VACCKPRRGAPAFGRGGGLLNSRGAGGDGVCRRNCAGRGRSTNSFPRGHADRRSIIVSGFPLALLLVPFAVLTGVVRVVLGLHYPSDVLAGVVIGSGVAGLSLIALPVP